MTERTTGYSLLILGIIVMIFATIQIISVFTGKAKPISVFQYEEKTSTNVEDSSDSNNFLQQLQNNTGLEGLNLNEMPNIQIIDPNVLNKLLNLTLYYLIMQFLLGLGYKFASLGTQLIRPIEVKMKNRTFQQEESENTTVS